MSRTHSLRISTAILLGAAALAFTAGTIAERSAHRDSEGAHADEHASAPITIQPTVTAPPTATDPSTPSPAPTSATGLNAPEGSTAREDAERAEHVDPPAVPTPVPTDQAAATPEAPDASAPEGSTAREAAEHAEGTHSDEAGERLFGINTESTSLIALADLISLALILLLLLARPGPALAVTAGGTTAFAAAAAVLDVREALHQHDLDQSGLMVAAAAVAVLHLLCALTALALLTYRQAPSKPVRPAT